MLPPNDGGQEGPLVTVHLWHHAANELSPYDIIQIRQSKDCEAARLNLRGRRRRPPPVVVAAWCFYAVFLVTALILFPLVLRAAGHALS